MRKALSRFGLAPTRRVELMLVLLLALVLPLVYSATSRDVLGESTTAGGICKEGTVDKITFSTNCGGDKYRSVNYFCGEGSAFIEGSSTSCKTVANWLKQAKTVCANKCSMNTPTLQVSRNGARACRDNRIKTPTIVAWSRVKGASSYIIKGGNSDTGTFKKLGTTKAVSYTVRDASVRYVVVSAVVRDVEGRNSNAVLVSPPDVTPCAKVTDTPRPSPTDTPRPSPTDIPAPTPTPTTTP